MELNYIEHSLSKGMILKIKYKGAIQKALLKLNSNSKFFLDIISTYGKCKAINHVFIPHIQTVFLQNKEKLRVYVKNYKDNFNLIAKYPDLIFL